MIIATPTPAGAGATLWGNLHDLRHLYDTIHFLADTAPFIEPITETVLGLAYDIRHAYMGDRDVKLLDWSDYGKETCHGEKVVWPILLFQASLLRQFAAYAPTTKAMQADLFRLEAAVEDALYLAEPSVASICMRWLERPFPITDDYYPEIVYVLTRDFVSIPRSKQRLKALPEMLGNLHPFSPYYMEMATQIEAEAARLGCDPHSIEVLGDWPTFKW